MEKCQIRILFFCEDVFLFVLFLPHPNIATNLKNRYRPSLILKVPLNSNILEFPSLILLPMVVFKASFLGLVIFIG